MSPKKEFIPYALLFAGVFCLFSLLSFQEADLEGTLNWFGKLGFYFSYGVFFLLGKASFLLALGLLALGAAAFRNKELDLLGKLLLLPLLILSISLALGFLTEDGGKVGDSGGVLGMALGKVLDFTIGATGKAILTAFLFTYSLFVILKDENLATTRDKLIARMKKMNSLLQGKSNFQFPSNWMDLKSYFQAPLLASESYAYENGSSRQAAPAPWEMEEYLKHKSTSTSPRNQNVPERTQSTSVLDRIWGNKLENHSSSAKETSKKEGILQFGKERNTVTAIESGNVKRKVYPKYKNTNYYNGNFEENRIYKFHEASLDLQRKLSETKDSSSFGFKILDYRTNPSEKNRESSRLNKMEDSYSEDEIENETIPGENHFGNQESYEKEVDRESYGPSSFEKSNSILNWDESQFEPVDWEDEELGSQSASNPSQDDFEEEAEEINLDDHELEEERDELRKDLIQANFKPTIKKVSMEESPKSFVPPVPLKKGYYISPKLLGAAKPKIQPLESKADSDKVARKIEEIISQFGIESKVVSMERGPIITRYELTIPNGVRLSKITSLSDELKYFLAVTNIRIVAPIPGKSTIGIEVPNLHREDVHLTELLRESSLAKVQGGLTICIGKDISGKSMNIDLTKLPHLLVAGTTGSGKSVCLNSMITSLIFTRSPEELRFIMIDPKMVEMTLYEEIPHLLMPVITDPKKATRALAWAIQEMEARYLSVSSLKCRDFQSYNQKVEDWAHKKGYMKMPYIVIFIDELSDLMMVSGRDLEEQITRISQKSRAVGIHLVMATQRPSVDVITGLIKANCPARMAFQVAQKTDSRTILDANGAESLLGKGDFLYRSPTASDLVRVQAPFVTEAEIESIVEESKKLGQPNYVEINLEEETSESSDAFEEDEKLIEDSWRVISSEGKASGSLLQRHLRIGYNKAARVIEILEKRGIISAQIGSKPREILKQL